MALVYRPGFSVIPNFGAASYSQEGVNCDVGEIEAAGAGSWERFCECSFGPAYGPQDIPYRKCLSKSCLLATGCWNEERKTAGYEWKDSWDGFNVHPGMLAAPWTEMGAAARGIEKRNPGAWYFAGRLVAISVNDYDPVNLWVLSFANPAYYWFLIAKVAWIPGIGQSILAVASIGPIALAPLAIPLMFAREASEPGYALKQIKRAGKGMLAAIQAAFAILGQDYPKAVAIAVQATADDLVESGVIVSWPNEAQAVVRVVAKNLGKVIDFVNLEKWQERTNWNHISDILRSVADEFRAAGNQPIADGLYFASSAIHIAVEVIYELMHGNPSGALDVVTSEVFGVKYSVIKGQMTSAPEKFKSLMTGISISPEQLKKFDALGKILSDIINALTSIKIPGFSDTVEGTLGGTKSVVEDSKRVVVEAQAQVAPLQASDTATRINAITGTNPQKSFQPATSSAQAVYARNAATQGFLLARTPIGVATTSPTLAVAAKPTSGAVASPSALRTMDAQQTRQAFVPARASVAGPIPPGAMPSTSQKQAGGGAGLLAAGVIGYLLLG